MIRKKPRKAKTRGRRSIAPIKPASSPRAHSNDREGSASGSNRLAAPDFESVSTPSAGPDSSSDPGSSRPSPDSPGPSGDGGPPPLPTNSEEPSAPASPADLDLDFATDATTPPPPSDWLEHDEFFVTGQRLSLANLTSEPEADELEAAPVITASQLERRARFRRWVFRSIAVLGVASLTVFAKHVLFPPVPLMSDTALESTPRAVEVAALTVSAATPDEADEDEPQATEASPNARAKDPGGNASTQDAASPNASASVDSSHGSQPVAPRVTPKSKPVKRKVLPKPGPAARTRALRSSPASRGPQSAATSAGSSSTAPLVPAQASFPEAN